MISYKFKNNELEIIGKMEEGDKVHGLCCAGYDWVCDAIIMSAWGHCENPDCQEGVQGDDDLYRSVSNWYDEDIALFLMDKDDD